MKYEKSWPSPVAFNMGTKSPIQSHHRSYSPYTVVESRRWASPRKSSPITVPTVELQQLQLHHRTTPPSHLHHVAPSPPHSYHGTSPPVLYIHNDEKDHHKSIIYSAGHYDIPHYEVCSPPHSPPYHSPGHPKLVIPQYQILQQHPQQHQQILKSEHGYQETHYQQQQRQFQQPQPQKHHNYNCPQRQPKLPNNNDTPVLPPCRVCGDKSTGIHYGAMTCEACKGFFRRSLSRKNDFHCVTGTQACDINYGGKTPCAFCRLAKCVSIGMSREGIKRGRYTLSQRTSHIKEVKALQESDSYAKKYLPKTPGGCMLKIPTSLDAATVKGNTSRENYPPLSEALLTAYLVHCQYPPEISENLEEIQNLYLKRQCQENEKKISYQINKNDLFTNIHQNGWLCKEKLKMLHKRIQFIEDAVKKLVCFSKNIPGFKKLPMDDQMTLVKSVQFYWWFLSIYPGISTKRDLYTTPLRETVSREEIGDFMTEKFANTLFRLAGKFNNLSLSEEERALVLGLSVVSTDGCPETEDQAAIDQIHNNLAQTLYYLTKDKYPEQPTRFGRIVAALTELRSAEAPHVESEDTNRGHNERVEVPPLLLELWAALPRKQ